MKQTTLLMLLVVLAVTTSTRAPLGDTQKEFEQAHPDFKYVGESPGNEPNSMVREYAGDDTVAQIAFGADGKVIMEAYGDLAGKFPESSLVSVAKSYGYDFSGFKKISISAPWKALVLHRDFWFSANHKFCIGIGDVVMNDSQIISAMTVAGEQIAPTLYQNSAEKRSDEPAKTSATLTKHDQIQLAITATITLIWIVCIVACFLKWKTWTAIFGVIGLVVGNLPTMGTHLHYLVMGPATSVVLGSPR
jgi:hypothetical protein